MELFIDNPSVALLWHGSRVTNFVGILSEGLKIAPPDAPVTGYMFGKGIYFADVPSKSANYCCATPENPEGLLLLCEVALGDMYRVYQAKQFKRAPKYFHSVYGVGIEVNFESLFKISKATRSPRTKTESTLKMDSL